MSENTNKNEVSPQAGDKTFSSLADLTPDPANARKHNPRNVGMLVDSLHQVGAARSIVVDENGVVLAGNATIEAAAEAGIHRVKTVEADGSEIVAVVRRGLSQEQKTKLALYDNRVAELAEWNPEVLSELVDTQALEGLFSDKELAEILTQTGIEPKDAEPQIDKAEELRQKWGTESGQLWVIGDHRLLVGDSTNKADVGRLCADNKPSLMVTDPPYGVAYEGGVVNIKKRQTLSGDEDTGCFAPALAFAASVMDKESAWYVWHADREARAVYEAIEASGFDIRALVVWNKLNAHYGAPSAHYCQKHEPCLYAVRGNARWIGPSNEVTVWDIPQPSANEHHPTQKPLECMARPIRNHSGDVYDPFVGSGTTLVAAENLSRKCYAIEISPAYVAVCLERMATAFPALKIEKVDQARAA